jgi:hypothetical protein
MKNHQNEATISMVESGEQNNETQLTNLSSIKSGGASYDSDKVEENTNFKLSMINHQNQFANRGMKNMNAEKLDFGALSS